MFVGQTRLTSLSRKGTSWKHQNNSALWQANESALSCTRDSVLRWANASSLRGAGDSALSAD